MKAWASKSAVGSVAHKVHAPARLGDEVTARAASQGTPYVSLADGRELVTAYEAISGW